MVVAMMWRGRTRGGVPKQNTPAEPVDSGRQRELFERLHDSYAAHYYDQHSSVYRDRFIHAPLLRGLDVGSLKIVELMCGDGPVTRYLRDIAPEVAVTGVDISPSACEAYARAHGRPALALDIAKQPLPANAFDLAVVVGGLHHVAPHLDSVFANVRQALRAGGMLAMFEPSSRFALQFARRLWYRRDPFFDPDNEDALDYASLRRRFGDEFEETFVAYMGGPGYFLVLNSLILRMPLRWKRHYARALTGVDAVWNRVQLPAVQACFLARWLRR